RLLESLAGRRPLVLFLDDLQWGDAASLDLLHYCARRWPQQQTPALLLANLRAEAPAAPALADWLASLGRVLPLSRLTLGPVTVEDTWQLVETLAGPARAVSLAAAATDAQVFAGWLFRETGGQPFFMVETLKTLLERQLLVTQPNGGRVWAVDFGVAARWLATEANPSLLPPGVQDLVQARLRSMSPAATALLAAGAVLGQGLRFPLLCQVAGLGEDEGLVALDEARQRQLLRPAAGPMGFTFAHDKIRDVVYEEMGETRRLVFHRRAFSGLQAAGAPPAILAHHALAAGLAEEAFQASLAAGDEALRLFAVRDAIAFYEQARSLAGGLPSGMVEVDQAQHLYQQLGRAYELDNRFEQAQATYEALLAIGRSHDQPAVICNALVRLAGVAALFGLKLAEATEYLHQAEQVAREHDLKAGLAEVAWNLAQMHFYALEGPATVQYATQALTLARQAGLQDLAARSLNALAYGSLLLRRWEEVGRYAEEGRQLFAALGNQAMEADCLALVAAANVNSGRPQAGIEAGRLALAKCREIGNGWGQVNSVVQLVPGLLDIGAYEEALEVARQGVATAEAQALWHMLPMALVRLGAVYRMLGEQKQARETLLAAVAANDQNPLRPFAAVIAAEQCALAGDMGLWEEAYRHALEVQATEARSGFLYTGLEYWYEVEALLKAGASEVAAGRIRQFSRPAAENPRLRLAHERAQAVLAAWEDSGARAKAHTD
ncbi:MAG: hypothetical protein L0322_22790, partial [Chloroflexi bacterium]|nr:hypothetical protein [Chloroflexota bacterium]